MERMHPLVNEKLPRFFHGGDYNPEQWSPEVWQEDMRLMKLANVNVATVGVFSWVSLQPAPGHYEFGWLDTIMDSLADSGLYACLATPSAAHPAWLSRLHPEVLRADANGRRRRHGGRVNYCPNSTVYRGNCATIARKLAERYRDHPALVLWHVSNEYAGLCYCENCAAAFRRWLQEKYASLDGLNERWYTAFWGHTYTDWEQVEPPYENGETRLPALSVDFLRFGSHSLLECFLNEARVLREVTPEVPVTTNLWGHLLTTNYHEWAPHLDVVSWDCYPSPRGDVAATALMHDLMYGLKGRPFLLMEQTPSSQNWQAVNALKRPDQMRLWSYQAVAHGADSVMYFQWRRGRGGCEKLHGAVVEHAGHEETRLFREVSALGAELAKLEDNILGAAVEAEVALLFDWENWWTLRNTSGPVRDKKYHETLCKHYRALWQRNVPVALIGPEADLSPFRIVIAPLLYMTRQDWAERIEEFVRTGGRFVTTCLSGWVNEDDLAHLGGYPGPLRELTGVWVEEIDALYEGQENRIIMKQPFGPCRGEYRCGRLCDVMHAETASVLATYGEEFYAGWPAVTENAFGEGRAYYIGTDPEPDFLLHFYRTICADSGVFLLLEGPEGVEVCRRSQKDRSFLFILNHNEETANVALPDGRYRDLLNEREVSGAVALQPFDVRILQEL
ncbi:MAG: beta-galactosidase [Planctomycetota bacterium]